MGRFFASLVVASIIVVHLEPSVWGAVRSNSPACCRRNGQHHCAGMQEVSVADSRQPAFRTPATHCPYSVPQGKPTTTANDLRPAFVGVGLSGDNPVTKPSIFLSKIPPSPDQRRPPPVIDLEAHEHHVSHAESTTGLVPSLVQLIVIA